MEPVIESLKVILANTYTLFLMTQNYHWNIKGEDFYTLHKLFESQYDDMYNAIDEIAERIAGMDSLVPGTFEEFANFTDLKVETGNDKSRLDAKTMLKNLKESHKIIITSLEKGLDIAGEQGDEVSFDLLVQRLKAHNKMLWMISKSLE